MESQKNKEIQKTKKEVAKEFGEFAEEITARHYIRNGYTILERNWFLHKTEIDIIAQKEDTIVLIEVKARSTKEEDALSAVTVDKRRRMIRAADFYLRNLPGDLNYRFDIATCVGDKNKNSLHIHEDAFVAADIF